MGRLVSAQAVNVTATRDVIEWGIAEANRAAVAADNAVQALHDAKHQAPPEIHDDLVKNADLIAGVHLTACRVRAQLRDLHAALAPVRAEQ